MIGRAAILAGLMAALTIAATAIEPVPLPDPKIPGFRFPESEATIVSWVFDLSNGPAGEAAPQAFENIATHGWGLWAAVTRETGQVYAGHDREFAENGPLTGQRQPVLVIDGGPGHVHADTRFGQFRVAQADEFRCRARLIDENGIKHDGFPPVSEWHGPGGFAPLPTRTSADWHCDASMTI